MKQGPYRGRRGKLHRHGKTKRKSLNVNRSIAAIRHHNQTAKYA